jgi:hypothetical protein
MIWSSAAGRDKPLKIYHIWNKNANRFSLEEKKGKEVEGS